MQEFSSPHNPEVVGSSPASATITETVMDTNVSVTVSFYIRVDRKTCRFPEKMGVWVKMCNVISAKRPFPRYFAVL